MGTIAKIAFLIDPLWSREFSFIDLQKDAVSGQRSANLQTLASVLLASRIPAVDCRHSAHGYRNPWCWVRLQFSEQTKHSRRASSVQLIGNVEIIPPIGPLFPLITLQYSASSELETIAKMVDDNPDMIKEWERFAFETESNGMPNPDLCMSLSNKLFEQADALQVAQTRMSLNTDFRSHETRRMTEAWLKRNNASMDDLPGSMRWQAQCLRAVATGLPAPPPPPSIDLEDLAREGPSPMQKWMSSLASMTPVDEEPFREDAFESETVQQEFEALAKDHKSLISMGRSYGTFDPSGKLGFLDALDAIEDRWDVFITRFKLMGAINQKFEDQISKSLASMNLTTATYRELVREAHQLMREAAEKEARAL